MTIVALRICNQRCLSHCVACSTCDHIAMYPFSVIVILLIVCDMM